jgi:hypothetical protein
MFDRLLRGQGATRAAAAMVGVTALAVTLVGCGAATASPTAAPSSSAPTTDPGAVTVLVSKPMGSGMDALGGGQLEVLGTCLGAGGTVVVWPVGTKVTSTNPLKISIPNLGSFSLGDTVRIGGGGVPRPSPSEPWIVGGVEVPESCTDQGVFLAADQN